MIWSSEGFFVSAIESSIDCVQVLDLDGRLVFMNEAGRRLLELDDPAKIRGRRWLGLWPAAVRGEIRAAVEAARRGETIRLQADSPNARGTPKTWDLTVAPLRDLNGEVKAMLCNARDVSDWREAMDRLKTSERQAQAAAEAMASFLATMSHEIRTPLNGVLGMAEAMELGELAPSQRERLKVIQESGRALLGLLNDLLDLARIQEGQIQLEDGAVVVEDLCAGARATFEALVRDKDVDLVIDIGDAARGAWRGDPTRVRQIVTNLLSNAVKFTQRGHVRLALNHDGANLVIEVEDTGVGIPPERLPHVFDRFVQADASTTRRYGGSGLGLAICRDLVELMNGSIFAESWAGSGSRFTFTFPTEPVEAPAAGEDDAASVAGSAAFALRVLAAEDNATNRMVLSALLGELGCQLSLAHNGAEALAAFRTGVWDVVLLDIQMPVMDGVTAMRLMRETELASGRPRTPILALTANAMEHQKAQYLAAGADGLVAKPISLAGLVSALEAALAADEPAPASAVV